MPCSNASGSSANPGVASFRGGVRASGRPSAPLVYVITMARWSVVKGRSKRMQELPVATLLSLVVVIAIVVLAVYLAVTK